MRLFSKVKPGAAFVEAESSIRSQQETRAEEAEQEAEENVRQLKVCWSSPAVKSDILSSQPVPYILSPCVNLHCCAEVLQNSPRSRSKQHLQQ